MLFSVCFIIEKRKREVKKITDPKEVTGLQRIHRKFLYKTDRIWYF